jgi:hypothetical protein
MSTIAVKKLLRPGMKPDSARGYKIKIKTWVPTGIFMRALLQPVRLLSRVITILSNPLSGAHFVPFVYKTIEQNCTTHQNRLLNSKKLLASSSRGKQIAPLPIPAPATYIPSFSRGQVAPLSMPIACRHPMDKQEIAYYR